MSDDIKCAAQHFGPWMIQTAWLSRAVAAVRDGTFQAARARASDDEVDYAVDDGIARIRILGQITKGESSFGGASSIRIRRALRGAVADKDVSGILLVIDSPGGTVAGTPELAAEVVKANALKPVHAYIEDLGASAAYWAASQARYVSANATAFVGSIGTVAFIEDSTGAFEKEGIVVHVVSTGAYKGLGMPGTPVTQEHLDYLQEQVDDLNKFFLKGVASGRGMKLGDVRDLADGRDWVASKAQAMGLIDSVQTYDEAVKKLRAAIPRAAKRRQTAEQRIRLTEA